MSVHSSFQEHLKSNSGGLQSLFCSQLKVETKETMIMDFETELIPSHHVDYQKGNPSDNSYLSSPMEPLVSFAPIDSQCMVSSGRGKGALIALDRMQLLEGYYTY